MARSFFQGREQPRAVIRKGPAQATSTAALLADVTATINTAGKFAGKAVWVTDAARIVFAAGATAGAVWKDGVNSTVYTPV
jgi:hypothetical protein